MKAFNKTFLIIALALFSIVAKAQDKLISFGDLPRLAQDFVTTYYSADLVSYIMVDKEFLSTSYEVKLKNGVEIDFDSKGNWTEVDAKKKAVPHQLVNPKILAHVKKRFPNNEIVQLKLDGKKVKLELTNGLDLVFSKSGEFVRVED